MKLLRRSSRGFLALIFQITTVVLLFTGCQTTNSPSYSEVPASAASPTSAPVVAQGSSGAASSVTAYVGEMDKFRIGDLVSITFSGFLDAQTLMPQHEETIKEDGTVTLPLIGSVKAVGKSAGDLQREIHDLYVPKYYVRLNVNVKPAPRSYTVGGEVKMPGPKLWETGTTVIKAIQAAGDFTDFAKKTQVKLTRASDGTVITVNCKKAIKDPRLDPLVFPGDVIHVPRRIL